MGNSMNKLRNFLEDLEFWGALILYGLGVVITVGGAILIKIFVWSLIIAAAVFVLHWVGLTF